ncbi:MAG: HAD-IIIA family hydrolase [Chloroflexi bacterium]|nr:HAD-IIIA family hydrolase [Chloroflexota bacterium]
MANSTGSGWEEFLQRYVRCVTDTLAALPWGDIARAMDVLHDARLRRASVFLCGNGGSAATASHFVNDLNKGANVIGLPRFRAIGLTDNLPLLTAWSNDTEYANAFAEPLRNLARPGDVLIGISGSGNSPNVLQAARLARQMGLTTVGMVGGRGGQLAGLVDVPVVVGNACMEQIEDVHMVLEHAIISGLRDRGERELVPSLILADGSGASPQTARRNATLPRRPAIFLDRDGVINANRDDYVKSWEELALLPGVLGALQKLARLGWPVVVVTNQAIIARELATFEMVENMNRRLMALVAAYGGRLDAITWCPHRPEQDCTCRKPKPGLIEYAAEMLNLDLCRSYLVGDAESDIAAGLAAGCKPTLVLTGRGNAHCARVNGRWADCRVAADLAAAVDGIIADIQAGGE